MKTLELTQMETIEGGSCGMTAFLAGAGLLIAATQPWSYALAGGLALKAIAIVDNCL